LKTLVDLSAIPNPISQRQLSFAWVSPNSKESHIYKNAQSTPKPPSHNYFQFPNHKIPYLVNSPHESHCEFARIWRGNVARRLRVF
jgi:hypothetical protein